MVRDPSIVSPSLTGVFIDLGGGHTQPTDPVSLRIEVHAAEAVSSPLSIVSLGDVGGGGGATDRELQEELVQQEPGCPRALPH